MVGTIEAATKASVAPVAPKSQAITCSRTRPSRRLARLPIMMTSAALAICRRLFIPADADELVVALVTRPVVHGRSIAWGELQIEHRWATFGTRSKGAGSGPSSYGSAASELLRPEQSGAPVGAQGRSSPLMRPSHVVTARTILPPELSALDALARN